MHHKAILRTCVESYKIMNQKKKNFKKILRSQHLALLRVDTNVGEKDKILELAPRVNTKPLEEIFSTIIVLLNQNIPILNSVVFK